MFKKLLALLTASFICLSTTMSAGAETVTSKDLLEEIRVNQIAKALDFVGETKSAYGLDDVDFNNLELGSSITTYEYIDGTFNVLGEMVPIFSGSEIVASAFAVGDGNYSIETTLATSISEMNFNEVAIVYDKDEAYLFNGSDFVPLIKSNISITERDDIDLNTIKNEEHHIVTTNIVNNERVRLQLSNQQTRNTLPFVECDVKYVTQNPYGNLCWAASIAMVKNYISSTSLTATDVSIAQFGEFKNEALSGDKVQKCMRQKYNLDYTRKSTAPAENVIYRNLSEGYPVIGVFSWENSGSSGLHDGVIFKINLFSNYISLMDPTFGSVAASGSSNGFKYISSATGSTLTLTAGYCYYWTYD